ncbi:lasso peptide biosynthesis PqqD family chaperone [Bacillus sp. JJ1566]|uniref:lasso peptide biosynthesis PqqD family chaperone n=1 Tax=Bacillus sp. JJ1566 TaxID=3122961 RepID=UPI002FFFA476
MGGEKVMLSVLKGKYYNLGEIGGAIWDLLSEPTTVEKLVTSLLETFDVDRQECESHVNEFLEQLRKEELIQLSNDI